MDIKSLIKREVLSHNVYPVENNYYPVRLDANESPFPVPDYLRNELLSRLSGVSLNRYPQAGAPELVRRFAGHFGVGEDCVMIGNGSDELIQSLSMAVAKPKAELMIPTPTFAMFSITPANAGLRIIEVPLDADFDLDLAKMSEKIMRRSPALTLIASPNNPTGNCFSFERIEDVIAHSPGLVVVDEAYFNFSPSGRTFMPLLKKYDNLVILRTLSKVGFAAARIGILAGSPKLVGELDKVRLPYNFNALSQAVAGFYLDHEEVFLKQAQDVRVWRDALYSAMLGIVGIHPRRSDANFIFFSCDFDSDRIYKKLLERGILIKNFNRPGRMSNFMRVTVGTPEENELFTKGLEEVIKKQGA
jgi:histidinol-phosphate aminotransferase